MGSEGRKSGYRLENAEKEQGMKWKWREGRKIQHEKEREGREILREKME